MYAVTPYPAIPNDHILAPVAGGMRWRRPEYYVLDYGYTNHHEEDHEDAEEQGYFGRYEEMPCPRRHRDDYISPLCHPLPEPAPDPEPEREQVPLCPVVTTAPPTEARVAEIYCYAPNAHDGIATAFTWSLGKTAPSGMSIDRHSGKITWTPTEGGHYPITIHARSVYGAESNQTWTVCVRKARQIRSATQNQKYHNALRRKAETAGAPPLAHPFAYSPWPRTNRPPASPRLSASPVDAARSPPIPLRL